MSASYSHKVLKYYSKNRKKISEAYLGLCKTGLMKFFLQKELMAKRH